MPKRTIADFEELKEWVGQEVGVSDWHLVTQEAVHLFAEATGDRQWIHVDPDRARRESPFGGPIAHGYYTLSLAIFLMEGILEVREKRIALNYGLNRLRFTAPVPIPSRLRLRATLIQVAEIQRGVQATFGLTFETEGGEKPACVAEAIYRYYK
ncbi:MAG: MaoC family dehydratase [Deltaproteobacteria bacterium]|nr:MaoC family dehydratase [Deltaproteobacteria bacterium]